MKSLDHLKSIFITSILLAFIASPIAKAEKRESCDVKFVKEGALISLSFDSSEDECRKIQKDEQNVTTEFTQAKKEKDSKKK